MSVNNDNFLIDREEIEKAQEIAGVISNNIIRNRAVANIFASEIAKKYFSETAIDIESGIHNIPNVLTDIDISDIYIDNNYIDVRLYFNENELYIPKSHFDMGILPVAYMFIKLSDDLSNGQVSGFMFPEDIDTSSDVNGHFVVTEDSLMSYYDVDARLSIVEDEEYDSEFEKNVYRYLDKESIDKNAFYKLLISSVSARNYFINTAKAHRIYTLMNTSESENDGEDLLPDPIVDSEISQSNELLDVDEITPLEISGDVESLESFTSDDNNLMDINDISLPEETGILEEVDGESLLEEPYSSEPDPSNSFVDDVIEPQSEDSDLNITESEDLTEETTELENFDDQDINTDYVYEQLDNLPDEEQSESPSFDQIAEENEEEILSDVNNEVSTDSIIDQDEFEELAKFDYSTEIAPSISSIEDDVEEQEPITEEMLEASDTTTRQKIEEEQNSTENDEQIEALFDNTQKAVNTTAKKKSALPLLGFIVVAGALGYFGYTKYLSPISNVGTSNVTNTKVANSNLPAKNNKAQDVAMPIETVENTAAPKQEDEAVSVDIPAIEQNLNASIEVSNLSVNWEVPLSYANNTTAKRYFVRIGKILQLNLKTELLLISSPPITNQISMELEFNKANNKFVIGKMINSSGVTSVDNVIKETINRTLEMNMNMNMNVFNNLQGNPVLVIKL